MKNEETLEEKLAFYSGEYASVLKNYHELINDVNYDKVKVDECKEKIHELEFSLVFYAMQIAGYESVEKDGICQYIKVN